MTDTIDEWVCTALELDEGTRGLALTDTVWPKGTTLKIGFIGGSQKLRDRVLANARRWCDPAEGGANLAMAAVSDVNSADIRVSFDPRLGSWSHLGTQSKKIAKGQPTMNLGWVTETLADKAFGSVTMHEFGHALGLLHEHNHPEAKLNWNRDAVYADLMGPPNNWTKATVDFNVFDAYPTARVTASSNPDLVSIMIYTIPSRWLMGQPGIMPSDQLSQGDKDFIKSLYPA